MDFDIPADIAAFLAEVDQFIKEKIKPLEEQNDNIRFFDHRREDARTDWHRDGLPNEEWEDLLRQAKDLAIEAGIYSYPFPAELGGDFDGRRENPAAEECGQRFSRSSSRGWPC